MKPSTPSIFNYIGILAIGLIAASCNSDNNAKPVKNTVAGSSLPDSSTLIMRQGIDLRGGSYEFFHNSDEWKGSDLGSLLGYLKQLPDSIRTKHFYLIVDSSTAKSRIEQLTLALPESGIHHFEVMDLYKFSQTVTEPVSMELNMPKD